jgi:hypothetical protein
MALPQERCKTWRDAGRIMEDRHASELHVGGGTLRCREGSVGGEVFARDSNEGTRSQGPCQRRCRSLQIFQQQRL